MVWGKIIKTALIFGPILFKGADVVAKNLLMDKVQPVKGSIVCCYLGSFVEHSGVYLGDDIIAHRDGNGYLEKVSYETFLKRLNGINPAWAVYVSCSGKAAVGSDIVASRALKAVENSIHAENKDYKLLFKNCHHFSQYCLTGISSEKQGPENVFFTSLEKTLKDEYGFNKWRVWDKA